MAFSIDARHRLRAEGRLVERIMAPPAHSSGRFERQPDIIVIHFTYGASGRSSANWFKDPANPQKSSAHIVVDRDGSVIQCVDFDVAAHHAGRSSWGGISGLNRFSYGIELANWGYLRNAGGRWTSYTGTPIGEPVLAVHKNGNPNGSTTPIGWEPYPHDQLHAAMQIARTMAERYAVREIVGHDDISVGRKWDPGPAFDMAAFRSAVLEDQSDSGPNRLRSNTPGDSLNLRAGPGMHFAVIGELPHGTVLAPQTYDGSWVLVHVLREDGQPTRSGWVYARLTVPA